MSVENEIVKFTARIEMDEATAKQVQQSFDDTSRRADELRERVRSANEQLLKLRMEGKEGTAQFKALEASLQADAKALAQAEREADKYAATLGINQMSMKQLKQHAKQLRSELDKMHKEADPKRFAQYSKELAATEKRMKELGSGSKSTGNIIKQMGKSIVPTFDLVSLGIKAVNGLVKLGKKIWADAKNETQKWGDTVRRETAAAQAVWHQFIRNMSASRGEVTLTYKEVAQLAREAHDLKDEIFELTNSYKVHEAEVTPRMQELEAVFRDTSKPIEERKEALAQMKDIELTLANERLLIAEQEEQAAFDHFKKETAMEREQAEDFIKNYIEKKQSGIVKLADEYGRMQNQLEEYDRLVSEGAGNKRMYAQMEALRGKIAATNSEVVSFYTMLQQYNLGSDATITAYANAFAARLQAVAAADPSAMEAKYVRLNSSLNRGGGGHVSRRERKFNAQIDALDEEYKEQLHLLKQALANQEITEKEYEARSLTYLQANLNAKLAVYQAYGKDTIDLENQLADLRISQNKEIFEALNKADQEYLRSQASWEAEYAAEYAKALADMEAEVEEILENDANDYVKHLSELMDKAMEGEMKSRAGKISVIRLNFDTEMAALEEMHNAFILADEEYNARKKALYEETAKAIAEANTASFLASMEIVSEYLENISDAAASFHQADLDNLEAQKEKELAIVGDNADARNAIEEEYEKKKLDVEKKYADVDMAINIAKTVANGAVAAIKSFAELGPVAGAIMAGTLAIATAAEITSIIAQRNAIKNASPSASSTSASVQGTGFSDGGYTGDGGRLEPAGIVHRGEYVVPQPIMHDPAVAAMIASIEAKRRQMTSRNALPGYAEGGAVETVPQESTRFNDTLDAIYGILQDIYATPIPAYIYLSSMEAAQEKQRRFKKVTSLRRH